MVKVNRDRIGGESDISGEWWQELFDSDWTRIYSYKNQDAPREARAIARLLCLAPGSKILDLCCGDGRISVALARLGYKVTGLDFSQELLDRAKRRASRARIEIEWVQGDMREIDISHEFDAVVNISTSFGYFRKEEDDLKVLNSVRQALKEDGKFILDLENIYFLARQAQIQGSEPMYLPIDNFRGWVEEINCFDPVAQTMEISLRFWLADGNLVKEGKAHYRAYSSPELCKMLEATGFSTLGVFGDFNLLPYDIDSPRMIILSHKID